MKYRGKALNKGFQATAHKLSLCDRLRTLQSYTVLPVGRRLNPDVQRPDNYQKYGELATTTPTARKIEENIRAIPPYMKIISKIGLKIGVRGSTSPKPRYLGHFYGFRGLQA